MEQSQLRSCLGVPLAVGETALNSMVPMCALVAFVSWLGWESREQLVWCKLLAKAPLRANK